MDFREVHQQSLTEMEELRKFQSSSFDTIARRKLVEDQNTIMELSGRLQELQNEVNCDGETITWHQRSQLDSADRESPSTTSTSKWSSTTSSIHSFQQRIKRCDYSCWEHWTMRDSRRGAEIIMQSMPDVLGRWHHLLHVWTLLARWYNRKQEVHLVRAGFDFHPELLHKEGPATRSQVREETWLQRIPHGKSTSKKVSKEEIREHSRSVYPWYVVQKDDDRVGSLWISHPWNGPACKRRPQSYCHRRRNWCISWKLVDPLEFCEFRHDADKASTWLQESIVDIAPPQENGGQCALWKLVAQFLLMVKLANNLVASLLWDITTTMDLTQMERGNLRKSVNCPFTCGMSLTTNLVQKLQWQNSVTANAVHCHRRGV